MLQAPFKVRSTALRYKGSRQRLDCPAAAEMGRHQGTNGDIHVFEINRECRRSGCHRQRQRTAYGHRSRGPRRTRALPAAPWRPGQLKGGNRQAWGYNNGYHGHHNSHRGRNVAIGAFAAVLGLAIAAEAARAHDDAYYDDDRY